MYIRIEIGFFLFIDIKKLIEIFLGINSCYIFVIYNSLIK